MMPITFTTPVILCRKPLRSGTVPLSCTPPGRRTGAVRIVECHPDSAAGADAFQQGVVGLLKSGGPGLGCSQVGFESGRFSAGGLGRLVGACCFLADGQGPGGGILQPRGQLGDGAR